MTTHYEVLRPVEPADLDTHARFVKVLKAIPPGGYVMFEQFRRFEKNHAVGGIGHACLRGILKRVSPHERILKLNSVQFWCTQFEEPGYKHTAPQHNTRTSYLGSLSKFDNWLRGRAFPSYDDAAPDGTISFENVEMLMKHCEKPANGPRIAQRVMREYAAALQAGGASAGVQVAARSAIKSYFTVHDIALALSKSKKKRAEHAPDNAQMSLEDFYKMLQNGRPSIMMRTIMLIKLQSGMDSATFTDRFNYEGYGQIVKYFNTDNCGSWNLSMCPVPIKTVRVKTGIPYTTFIDHDAVVQLQEYLAWKEAKHGRHDENKPLFVTKRDRPIYSSWLSTNFSKWQSAPAYRRACQTMSSRCGARSPAPPQEPSECERVQAVRRRPHSGPCPARCLRKAGNTVPGGAARRVRQGIFAHQHNLQGREQPEQPDGFRKPGGPNTGTGSGGTRIDPGKSSRRRAQRFHERDERNNEPYPTPVRRAAG